MERKTYLGTKTLISVCAIVTVVTFSTCYLANLSELPPHICKTAPANWSSAKQGLILNFRHGWAGNSSRRPEPTASVLPSAEVFSQPNAALCHVCAGRSCTWLFRFLKKFHYLRIFAPLGAFWGCSSNSKVHSWFCSLLLLQDRRCNRFLSAELRAGIIFTGEVKIKWKLACTSKLQTWQIKPVSSGTTVCIPTQHLLHTLHFSITGFPQSLNSKAHGQFVISHEIGFLLRVYVCSGRPVWMMAAQRHWAQQD